MLTHRLDRLPFLSLRCCGLLLLIFIGLGWGRGVWAQSETNAFDNRREGRYGWQSDSIHLDTASVVPGSVHLRVPGGDSLPRTHFQLDWIRSTVYWTASSTPPDSVRAHYRVLKRNWNRPVQRYPRQPARQAERARQAYLIRNLQDRGFGYDSSQAFATQLQRRGAISRGIAVGNAQNVSMTSHLDLQLAGPLSEDLEIQAALTDNQLPVQPEGNSAQIQEFDQVYIRVFNERHRLNLGDFQAQAPASSHFLQFQKKGRGLDGSTRWQLPNGAELEVSGRLALSRGQFARNTLQGEEGNLGPYNLRGNKGELFIIILSGTERVFLNGEQLQRSQDADYVIDYNTGALTFTPKHLISAYDRIVVEFQYTGQAYDRSMQHLHARYHQDGWRSNWHYYNEQDSRNRPLFRSLSDEDLSRLAASGDEPALSPQAAADSVGFRAGAVRYRRVDTMDFGPVYVYDTRPERAVYQLRFSYVGEGQGHYVPVSSSVNGQVFRWVAPIDGQPQGSYAPNSLLIPPEKRSLMTWSLERDLAPSTVVGLHGARSTLDRNTFSVRDSADDHGHAMQLYSRSRWALRDDSTWLMEADLATEWKGRHFRPVERYRPVEFSRYWNQQINNPNQPDTGAVPADHLGDFQWALVRRNWSRLSHRFVRYRRHADAFSGDRHETQWHFYPGHHDLKLQLGWTDVRAPDHPSRPFRRFRDQAIAYERSLGRFRVGSQYRRERNDLGPQPGGVSTGSYRWEEQRYFIGSDDTSRWQWRLRYRNRFDRRWALASESFQDFTRLHEYQLDQSWRLSARHDLETMLRYRNIEYPQDRDHPQSGHHYTAHIQHRGRWLEDWMRSDTRYELGTGRVQRQQYVYVEVAAGQGIYTWIDYNDNGVQEQDEFERAAYEGDANFVRIITPTNVFIPSQTHAVRQQWDVVLGGRELQAQERSFWQRFAGRTIYELRSQQYRQGERPRLWPRSLARADTQILNLQRSFRQQIDFNRNHPVSGLSLAWHDQAHRQLLSGGGQTMREQRYTLEGRWNFARSWELRETVGRGFRSSQSEFLRNQNYQLQSWENTLRVRWQPVSNFRTGLGYVWENSLGEGAETSIAGLRQDWQWDTRWGMPERGRLNGRLSYSTIALDGDENRSAAYQILQGLRPGANWIVDVRGSRKLSEHLYLDVHFNSRLSEGRAPLHTGSMSARWSF